MRDIGKANFYKSYFLAAQKLDNDLDRLSLYDTILNYIFEGVEPDNLTLNVDLIFTSIKSFIDADLSRKLGGAPMGNINSLGHGAPLGNQNAKKNKQPTNNLSNNLEKSKQTNKVEVEEEVNVEEEVEVKVNDTNLPTIKKLILDFATTNGFKFGAKTVKELTESLSKTLDPKANLEAQLDFIKSKYPDKTGDELAKLYVSSLHWDNAKPKASKPKNIKSIDYSNAPKKCDCGGSVTPWGVPNSVRCTSCAKTWELNNGIWVSAN